MTEQTTNATHSFDDCRDLINNSLHDVRNHLNTIIISARAQKKCSGDAHRVEKMADLIEKSVREATALLAKLTADLDES